MLFDWRKYTLPTTSSYMKMTVEPVLTPGESVDGNTHVAKTREYRAWPYLWPM